MLWSRMKEKVYHQRRDALLAEFEITLQSRHAARGAGIALMRDARYMFKGC